MPDVEIVVPYWPGDPQRELIWDHLSRIWVATGWPVFEVSPGKQGWKAAALGVGLRESEADIVIVADADCWSDRVFEAVKAVERGGRAWCRPQSSIRRLTAEATLEVLSGRPADHELPLEQKAYPGARAGGIVVLNGDVARAVPPDPRFTTWGQEDLSWALALTCLHGYPLKLKGDLYHFWHAPEPRMDRRRGSRAGMVLFERYRAAARRRNVMQELVWEAHDAIDAADVAVRDRSSV